MMNNLICKCVRLCGVFILPFFIGCISKDNYLPDFEIPNNEYDVFTDVKKSNWSDTTSFGLNRDHPAIAKMRARALRISGISWSSKGVIPMNNGGYLTEGVHTGIPYSSVKECDKFIGQEVSFQTFLAAVNNPRSVLYTERINESPYKGTNCASYYGTVCSMTVNYALGLERPYASGTYDSLPFIQRLTHQDFNYVAPGDIVWKKGHVVLVTDVLKNTEGRIETVEILESNGAGTSLKKYSLKSFSKKWDNIEWVIYRYKNLAEIDDDYDSFLWNENSLSEVNEDLCLNRGNWVTYREGEDVVVNVLSPSYETVELRKDGVLIESKSYLGSPNIIFSGLKAGDYQVCLSGFMGASKTVSFEVVNTKVSIQESNNWVKISFNSSNAIPEYVVLCDETGVRYFISDLAKTELSRGYKIIKCERSTKGLYAKVFFKGKYGRVSNSIVPL